MVERTRDWWTQRSNWHVRLLAVLLTIFVCRGLIASVIVPAWQFPDEPVHFLFARQLVRPDGQYETPQDVERQVIASMARHEWWEPYGARTPDPLPTAFGQPDLRRMGAGTYAQPLYYGLAAAFLTLTGARDVERAYSHLRLLGLILGICTLAAAWAGSNLVFGPDIALGATAIAALHPQFLLATLGVNPDGLAILFGACLWWQIGRVMRGRRAAMSLALLVVFAFAAVFTKRNALPLAAAAAIVAVSYVFSSQVVQFVRRGTVIVVLLIVSAATMLLWWWLLDSEATELVRLWRNALLFRRATDETTAAAMAEHALRGIDYAWLIGGWLRFPAPEPWLWIARALTLVGFGSAAFLIWRSRDLRGRLVLAWLLVAIQAGSVLALTFLTLATPQGRYLFPVAGPAAALLWLGLTRPFPAALRPRVASVLLVVLAILDVTAFTTVLIPAYLS